MTKKTKKDGDRPGRKEKVPESARRLRELYARGMAEVEERRKVDPDFR